MDEDRTSYMRHDMRPWGAYYEPPPPRSVALQLMSNMPLVRDNKPHLSNGSFFHRESVMPQTPQIQLDYNNHPLYSAFHSRESKFMHVYNTGFGLLPDTSGIQTMQMLQPPEPPKEERVTVMDEAIVRNDTPLKKRSQGRPVKSPKPKKPKKVNNTARDDLSNGSVSKGKAGKQSTGLVINGIDLELSGIQAPVCSCTGNPQQCYRWGVGGCQSACCTTSLSQYPLPMSLKRKGARIAGRKMSQGAFTKVLEKLLGEGHKLSNPIDLKTFWAKHGTNKFVTIRSEDDGVGEVICLRLQGMIPLMFKSNQYVVMYHRMQGGQFA